MTDGMTILAELDARDSAHEETARVQIRAMGWELHETSGWCRASKGDQRVGGNTVLDVLDWINRRGARL